MINQPEEFPGLDSQTQVCYSPSTDAFCEQCQSLISDYTRYKE